MLTPMLDEFAFKQSVEFSHPRRVQNIVPGDFTQDGKLDLLVMAHDTRDGTDVTSMSVYLAMKGGGFGKCY